MQANILEEKQDPLNIVLSKPQQNEPQPSLLDQLMSSDEIIESKEVEVNNSDEISPKRQSMSPESKKDKDNIINNCAVLIIPLDNRVTPEMVANKFVKYGKILQVRPMKKSSSCIVIFSKASEAINCIRLFATHDKVRVTIPDQNDWNRCGDALEIKNVLDVDQIQSERIKHEKEAMNNKIANYEHQQSRITIMYSQRHAYQMLIENDEIEKRKRLKNNKLMTSRIETMYKTSEELFVYLKKMTDLEIRHEENIHKSVIQTFGVHENGGSVYSAGIAIDALNKNRYEQFNDINERVFKDILLSAQKYHAKLRHKKGYFQNRINKFTQKIEDCKVNMTQEWNKYQNILNRTLKAQQKEDKKVSNPDNLGEMDPFLSGKCYALAQREYALSLNEYNEEMTRLFNNIITTDKKRIDGIKTILIDYFLAQKAKAMNHVKLIESSLEYIKCVDKESDTSDFVKRFAHIQQNIKADASSSISIPSRSRSEDNKNKNKTKHKKAKSEPIAINKATLKQTPEGVLICGAKQTDNIAFNFSESETFAVRSKELNSLIFSDIIKKCKIYRQGRIVSGNWKPIHANVTKFGFFHTFEHRNDIKPIVSIPLKNITISMKDNDKRYDLYTFEIAVPNASWFSLTGTPTKYIFKVDQYKECVDWIKTLKTFAQH